MDPDTVQRYISWTRSVGLQTQADGIWEPNDPLKFLAHLCSVLSHGREDTSLLEIFKIASELHTVCLVCRTPRKIPHLQPYLACPHWVTTLQNTLDSSFVMCVTISRCDFWHGDTIHTTWFQPNCYPPQLLVYIRQDTSISSYLHRYGEPVDTPRKITTSHDNLFSRYGFGCFHPKRFSNHFVEEGEEDDDEVARIQYPPPSCGHLVKLACKGFAELQGSVIPAEHRFVIVQFGSSSSDTFCHASCLWKNCSFGKFSPLLRSLLSI